MRPTDLYSRDRNPYQPSLLVLPEMQGAAERGRTALGTTLHALRLLLTHFPLISAIVLPVVIPKNLLDYYLTTHVLAEEEWHRQIRVSLWLDRVFDPIAIAALIYALSDLKQGVPVRYFTVMVGGLRCWLRLFIARLIAHILIVLGSLALVVPGILLAVRWALLDCAVVLEELSAGEARRRSAQLTHGLRWKIFIAAILTALCLSVPVVPPLVLLDTDHALLLLIISPLADLLWSAFTILLFLFYQHALELELQYLRGAS